MNSEREQRLDKAREAVLYRTLVSNHQPVNQYIQGRAAEADGLGQDVFSPYLEHYLVIS